MKAVVFVTTVLFPLGGRECFGGHKTTRSNGFPLPMASPFVHISLSLFVASCNFCPQRGGQKASSLFMVPSPLSLEAGVRTSERVSSKEPLEGMACYAGKLLAPAEGFSLRQRLFCLLGK